MKKDIHPDYHVVTVEMTDGSTYQTRTTWGEEGEVLRLMIDSKSHPAYTGKRRMVDSLGRIEKFNRKYGRTSA